MTRIKQALAFATSLVWPPTKARLHRLVTAIGVAFAGVAIALTWWGTLGLTLGGKFGATIGMLTTLAAGWQRARPRVDAAIDGLPIPADDVITAAATPTAKAQAIVEAGRDASKGHALPSLLFWGALFGFIAALTFLLLTSRPARADTPITKCWASVCVGPEVSVSVLALTFPGRKIEAGILPVGSIGYGAHSVGDWWAAGVYLSARAGGGQPGYLAPAVLLRLFRAFTIGGQCYYGEDATRWSLLVGGGFGL